MAGLIPSFMIIGERKCGTTSLYHYLVEHPCVLPCRVKETQFFSRSGRSVRRNFDRYRAFFPDLEESVVESQMLDLDAEDRIVESKLLKPIVEERRYITGEASANVLMTVPPRRVHAVLPDIKLIAVVRDPVARAFSHHAMHQRFKREGRALFRCVGDYRRDFSVERALSRVGVPGPYLAPGRYAEHLERWWEVFPRAQLRVVRTEDLASEDSRAEVLDSLFEFLGLDPHHTEPGTVSKLNVASHVARDAVTEAQLREYFAPHNARLERLLGRPMHWG